VVFNRLLGMPERLKDPRDATRVWVPGEWSEPAEVSTEPSVVFFVVSQDSRNKQISTEIYKWAEGEWVKNRPKVGVGEPVASQARCYLPSFTDPTKADRVSVDFDAGVSVIDIDFERPYRERKRGTTRAGVKFGPQTTDCSVVFVGADGRLHERFVETDKGHPAKRYYGTREYKGPR
jgi:hypothetical protein